MSFFLFNQLLPFDDAIYIHIKDEQKVHASMCLESKVKKCYCGNNNLHEANHIYEMRDELLHALPPTRAWKSGHNGQLFSTVQNIPDLFETCRIGVKFLLHMSWSLQQLITKVSLSGLA